MDPSRFVLTDRQWLAIEPLCPGGLTAEGSFGGQVRRVAIKHLNFLQTLYRAIQNKLAQLIWKRQIALSSSLDDTRKTTSLFSSGCEWRTLFNINQQDGVKANMNMIKISIAGLSALAMTACAESLGQDATYENSKQIVTLNLEGGRSLDCLSGPWETTIWYDKGVVKNDDGTVVAEGTREDRAADYACREYFTMRSRGVKVEDASAEALRIFRQYDG